MLIDSLGDITITNDGATILAEIVIDAVKQVTEKRGENTVADIDTDGLM